MPSLANVPNVWKRWWDHLHKLSESPDINTTRLQEFIKKPPLEPEIATISAADMALTDVNNLFDLSELQGQENWHFPRRIILLRSEFDSWIDAFTELTRSSKPTEAHTRAALGLYGHGLGKPFGKARGQSDSTAWGTLTDGQWFYSIRLSNAGQWSVVAYRATRDGWGDIANMMAYMVLQGHKSVESSLRPRDLPIFFRSTSDSIQIQFRFHSDLIYF
ncbi:hypothetical protein VN97_g2133 [Penicillium thymicola]|uniref:Uncharacterized protein n=1 Tax=Penicillium thymicola TaxID=293382 RepID=A0AAI9TQG0_PENTH|nr:hypothetical protein VN97_g2133 [Penicillium thymicola]